MKKTVYLILAIAISSLCSSCHSYKPEDMSPGMKEVYKKASDSNPQACLELSDSLVYGHGVKKNLRLANHWLDEAQKLMYADAFERQADYYNHGIMVYHRSFMLAANFYAKAAAQGNVRALNKLSAMLADRGLANEYRKRWEGEYYDKRQFAQFMIAASYITVSLDKARSKMETLADEPYTPAIYWMYDYYTNVMPDSRKAAEWRERYCMRQDAVDDIVAKISSGVAQ